nr:hypothetical protein [Tanacetum cinerariifolium]
MGRDTVQLETAVSTISQEDLLEFTSEYAISEALHPELPGPEERIVDFPEGKIGVYTKFFEFANFRLPVDVFQQEAGEKYPSMLYQAIRFLKKLEQPLLLGGREGIPDYCGLAHKCSEGWDANREYLFPGSCDDTEHTSHPNPETTKSTTLLSRVEPQILPRRRDMDLFSLIRAPNPTKVKAGTRPRAAHEVPLLTVTASRVIEIEDPAATTDSSGEAVAPEVPSPENVTTTGVALEAGQAKGIAATGPYVVKERRKRGNDEVDTNEPPKVPRRDHADARPTESTHGGKSHAAIGLGMGSTRPIPVSQGAPVDVSDPDPLSFADPQSRPTADVTHSDLPRERPRLEIQNQRIPLLPLWSGQPKAFIGQNEYNVNLARQVAMGSQLRLRFEQDAKLLKKSVAQLARQDKRIQAWETEIKSLETLLEAEIDMKKVVEGKSAELSKELENLRALFSDLQVSNNRLSQQVSTLQAQVMGEEKLKAAFEEFKQYEDNWVEQRCAEMDARLDALSIDFDEELYPHMLTAIAGRRWVIGHGLRLAVMKCGESTELRQGLPRRPKLNILRKDLKYPIVDQLESLKDAPMDVIMASLHMESDTGDDGPQWIRELCHSSSQLTIPVYPEARDPADPWACKEEILLADAIAANVSHAEKNKKCRVVCRTHGVGSAHHARSNGVPISVPIVAPQGLAILLADAATQTEISEDEASPSLHWWCLMCSVGVFAYTPNVLGICQLRTQSPRPLGLQPVYAVGLLLEYLASNYSGTVMDVKQS